MQKKWIIKESDEEKIMSLQKALGIHPLFCKLLVQRGIETYEQAHRFFRPSLDHLHDPFLMKNMDKAVERIDQAISAGEKILIYGDYDVDGTTSIALVYSFLEGFYDNIGFYVPNRYTEGYGISLQGIDYAAENGFSLIIALDCGIRAIDQVAHANGKNIDFIICDHHLPGEVIPAAVAVLDPKQPECDYPYKELSGCGIGFKLIQALSHQLDIPKQQMYNYLDLVVISIGCDIVPLTGENRVLAFYGLEKVNKSPLPGIKKLMAGCGMPKNISITDLVFKVGPRINAAGRMDDARNAIRLLICDKEEEANKYAETLHANNKDRKGIDETITDHALQLIAADEGFADRKSTVVYHSDWHKGVIGIVASRLIEHHYRPTIVLAESDGIVAGSARSVKNFNIHDALKACSDLLEKYGGHKYAAGLSLKKSNLAAFKEQFETYVAENIGPNSLFPEIVIDSELDLGDIRGNFYNILRQFGPFGPDNMKPVFMTGNALNDDCRVLKEKHLKLKVRTNRSMPYNAIAFGQGQRVNLINGKPFKLCYTIEENEYRGVRSLQLNVKDISL